MIVIINDANKLIDTLYLVKIVIDMIPITNVCDSNVEDILVNFSY